MKKKCPHCDSSDVVWRGYRYNEYTKKRLCLCNKCGRKFTPDDGFFRMRFSPETIKQAVNLYNSGFSSSEVQRRLKAKGIKVSRWTIITWSNRYKKIS